MSKEVGEEERGARGGVDRRSDNATSVDEMLRLIRIAAVLAAARPTLLFRPLGLRSGFEPPDLDRPGRQRPL